MKPKHKAYLKLNLVSLFFVAVLFISITLAWFAYSGLTTVNTEVNVKAWHIDFDTDIPKKQDSNDIIISLSQIYPGMQTVNETVNIKNLGDSDAQLDYSITSARILNETISIDENHSLEYVLDHLSHDYPFHINISLNRNYVLAKGEDAVFNVSISWPLDSDTDSLDSEWGNLAYEFQDNENKELIKDPNYQVRTSIKVAISLRAEQYLENANSSDIAYNLGDLVLYDVEANRMCDEVSDTCLRTNVIDFNSKLGNKTVTLLPDLDNEFKEGKYSQFNDTLTSITSSWNARTRALTSSDIVKIVSNDITNSLLMGDGVSDSIIGYMQYNNRLNSEMIKMPKYNGYYKFSNPNYIYFSTGNCYWTTDSYDANRAFALKRIDLNTSMLYGEDKTIDCKVVPVIIATKTY